MRAAAAAASVSAAAEVKAAAAADADAVRTVAAQAEARRVEPELPRRVGPVEGLGQPLLLRLDQVAVELRQPSVGLSWVGLVVA